MKIAVTSDRPGLDGLVPELFAGSPWLLIVNADSGELLHAAAGNEAGDLGLAHEIVKWDCEGVLCGPIEKEPFIIIADEGGVTRYDAAGLTVRDAFAGMEARKLPLIRDYIGGPGCGGHDHSGGSECSGHHH